MTNEQTAVMLQMIASNLQDALIQADEELENVPRVQITTYLGNPLKHGLIPLTQNDRPDLYETTEGNVMALEPLRNVHSSIQNYIDGLLLAHNFTVQEFK